MSDGQPSLQNAGVGFALVAFAGLSTGIGAGAVYSSRLVKLANKPVLAVGLGFSGGVMLYVSFVEIFVKSLESFQAAGSSGKDANFLATLCLFAGMLLMRLTAALTHCLDRDHECCQGGDENCEVRSNVVGRSDGAVPAPQALAGEGARADGGAEGPAAAAAPEEKGIDSKLRRMGLRTALAIAVHNLPEGLATFVATLADPSVGATLAVAIAIHNIPEGLCVALPIFYASGGRHRAFLWALLSGISEPVGAFIGWLIFKSTGDDMDQTLYGVLFGLVAGMMVMIVLLELLPTGLRYDPKDRFVTSSMVLGMLVMAASLCLFQL